jgi:hypothetical protein
MEEQNTHSTQELTAINKQADQTHPPLGKAYIPSSFILTNSGSTIS